MNAFSGLVLLAIAGFANIVAFDVVMGTTNHSGLGRPTSLHFALLGLSFLLPGVLIALGLYSRTAWPGRRCALWGGAAFLVGPAAVMIFWVLTPFLPLSA